MQISFERFDLGVDLRKDAAVSDANRLREMKNAYVTTGLTTAKRPGFVKIGTLEPGTKGLFAAFGKLHTFYGNGTVKHSNTLFEAHKVAPKAGEKPIADVWYTDVFNNFLYTAVEYEDGTVLHHYLDGGSTQIEDENCPHTKACYKMQSKIFAVGKNGDVVLIDIDRPQFYPTNNILSSLVYSANGSEVDTVIIGGNVVLENGKVVGIDEKEIYSKVNDIVNRLKKETQQ